MSTFAELIEKPSPGVLYYFNVSTDGGATYTLRYSTAWFSPENPPSTIESQPRIKQIGALTRALGADRGLTAATIDVELENSDGGVDWLCDQSTSATAIASVWQLYCVVWDSTNASGFYGDVDEKLLGVFSLMNPPARSNGSVQLSLADDTLSRLNIVTPTAADWAAITDANRPFTDDEYRQFSSWGTQQDATQCFPIDSPLPVAWGYSPIKATHLFKNTYVICAVPGSAGALPTTIEGVFTGSGVSIPSTLVPVGSSYTAGDMTVWTVRRTPDIVKNGKTWHLLWLELDLTGDDYDVVTASGRGDSSLIWGFLKGAGYDLADAAISGTIIGGTGQIQVKNYLGYKVHDLVGPVTVVGGLMSHNANDLPFNGIQAATVVEDILTTCIPTAITTAGADTVNSLRPGSFAANRIDLSFSRAIQPDGSYFDEILSGQALTAIRQLCDLGQFDVFFKWDGTAKIAALAPDYASQTDTLATLHEVDLENVTESVPAVGDRGAPVNRTFINVDGVRYGPIDDAAAIAAWGGRIVARDIDGAWIPRSTQSYSTASLSRVIDMNVQPLLHLFSISGLSTIRPVIQAETGINGLAHEMGDYVKLTWTRGTIGGPYVDSVFRVEGISFQPMNSRTQLTLRWCDDLREPGNLPYILDDEDEYLVVAASGGRTCELTDGSTTIEFSSGDLGADGVALGDVLVVQDATESATAFKRNRSLIIVNIIDADTIEVDVSDFGSGGPFTITTWKIVHGADTTGRATYYGKTCTVLGQFYNLGEANRILEG